MLPHRTTPYVSQKVGEKKSHSLISGKEGLNFSPIQYVAMILE